MAAVATRYSDASRVVNFFLFLFFFLQTANDPKTILPTYVNAKQMRCDAPRGVRTVGGGREGNGEESRGRRADVFFASHCAPLCRSELFVPFVFAAGRTARTDSVFSSRGLAARNLRSVFRRRTPAARGTERRGGGENCGARTRMIEHRGSR